MRPVLHSLVIEHCHLAARTEMRELVALAVKRGCSHYSSLAAGGGVGRKIEGLLHEVLGCALMRLPMPDGFNYYRCGAMVLSDPNNNPESIADAAQYFGIEAKVSHMARLGRQFEPKNSLMQRLVELLPCSEVSAADELPGVSRLISETRMSGFGRGPVRNWLRTSYSPVSDE